MKVLKNLLLPALAVLASCSFLLGQNQVIIPVDPGGQLCAGDCTWRPHQILGVNITDEAKSQLWKERHEAKVKQAKGLLEEKERLEKRLQEIIKALQDLDAGKDSDVEPKEIGWYSGDASTWSSFVNVRSSAVNQNRVCLGANSLGTLQYVSC